jgi:hypothetical protein
MVHKAEDMADAFVVPPDTQRSTGAHEEVGFAQV